MEGPPTLAVVVGQRHGRWAREVGGEGKPCAQAREALQAAGQQLQCDAPDSVVGLAVVCGWRCVTGVAGHAQTLCLMRASLHYHKRRRVQRFLEHRVLAGSEVCGQLDLPDDWQHGTARVSAQEVLDQARERAVCVKDRFGGAVSVEELLRGWTGQWRVEASERLLWPVCATHRAVLTST